MKTTDAQEAQEQMISKYTLFQLALSLAMFINWLVFTSNFTLFAFGLVSGMALTSLLRDTMQ